MFNPPMPQVPRAKIAEEVDRGIELWHTNAEDDGPLEDYLAWTEEEYACWFNTGEIPQ